MAKILALVNSPKDSQEIVKLSEVDAPVAERDQAIVEVHASSLNRGELSLLRSRPEGWRPGQDIAGIVNRPASTGGPPVGTRIVGRVDGGGWSQQVAVDVDRLGTLPDAVSFEQAASLPIAGLTALRTLRLGGSLLGKRVLITGATGSVGSFAVQLASLAGALVTAVASQAAQPGEIRKLGAHTVVTSAADAAGRFDFILESVGGKSLEAAMSKVNKYGTIVAFGNSSSENATFNFTNFYGHEDVRILSYFSYASDQETIGEDLSLLAGLITDKKLDPQLGLVVDWTHATEGIRALADRKVTGKVLFKITQ